MQLRTPRPRLRHVNPAREPSAPQRSVWLRCGLVLCVTEVDRSHVCGECRAPCGSVLERPPASKRVDRPRYRAVHGMYRPRTRPSLDTREYTALNIKLNT